MNSLMFLPAMLLPAAGALLIRCMGERRANLREFWFVMAGVVMFRLIPDMLPSVLEGRAAAYCSDYCLVSSWPFTSMRLACCSPWEPRCYVRWP